jgi:hypothetical protein
MAIIFGDVDATWLGTFLAKWEPKRGGNGRGIIDLRDGSPALKSDLRPGSPALDVAEEYSSIDHMLVAIHLRKKSPSTAQTLEVTQPIETKSAVVLHNGTWLPYMNEAWIQFAGNSVPGEISDTLVIAGAIEQMGLQEFVRSALEPAEDPIGVLVVYSRASGETFTIIDVDPDEDPNRDGSLTLFSIELPRAWLYASKPPEDIDAIAVERLTPAHADEGHDVGFWRLTAGGPVACELADLPARDEQ